MKTSRTSNLSAIVALIVTGFYLLVAVLFDLIFSDHLHLIFLLLSPVLLFFFSFFTLKYVLEKFIYDKIRPIYKTILSLKTAKGWDMSQLENSNGDIISTVNQQVKDWAEIKKKKLPNSRNWKPTGASFSATFRMN